VDRLEVARLDPEIGRPLDNSTGIASPPSRTDFLDRSTGEVVPEWDPTTKWELQAIARAALGGSHRLRICHRHVRPDVGGVEVRRRIEGGRTFLGGLMVCGMVWVCPVCAPKVQAARAAELQAAMDAWTAQGGSVLLQTQTFRHSRADVLGDLQGPFREALRGFRSGKRYQGAMASLGLGGTVTGHEVTWGEANGWHPHAHSLLFVAGGVTPAAAHDALWPLWELAAFRNDLEVDERAYRVEGGSRASRYVNKLGAEVRWGAAQEVVRSHTKIGRHASMTPFDFLRAHIEDPKGGRWLRLYREFAGGFHGRNQLTWSRGFKRWLLGTEGRTDLEVAASIGERYEALAMLTHHEWSMVRGAGHHPGTVLRVFDLAGRDGLRVWLDSLREE
jgi:hypothetical protein